MIDLVLIQIQNPQFGQMLQGIYIDNLIVGCIELLQTGEGFKRS